MGCLKGHVPITAHFWKIIWADIYYWDKLEKIAENETIYHISE